MEPAGAVRFEPMGAKIKENENSNKLEGKGGEGGKREPEKTRVWRQWGEWCGVKASGDDSIVLRTIEKHHWVDNPSLY
jgi:hypothetical protein